MVGQCLQYLRHGQNKNIYPQMNRLKKYATYTQWTMTQQIEENDVICSPISGQGDNHTKSG